MLPAGYEVRLATADDLETWLDHLAAQQLENGVDGPYFGPYSPRRPEPPRTPEQLAQYRARLAASLDTHPWLRLWLAVERASGAVAGHADLAGSPLESERHRCRFGLGVLRAHHRRGLGRALLATAVAWARAQPQLAWIDLGVFADNAPARALYQRFGFVEQGRTVDRFRVDGVSIDDIPMALRL